MRRVRQAAAVASLCVLAACGNSSPPSSPPGSGPGETITGRERIGWDQPASSAEDLARFQYAIYVDGARSLLTEVSCGTTAGPAGFSCSGRLPPMSNGTHVLELASYIDSDGIVESTRSAPLRVTVTGVGAEAVSAIAQGEIFTTSDGVRLRADVLYEGLSEPSALAVAPDGRAFVGTSGGVVVIEGNTPIGEPRITEGRVLAIAFSPAFDRDAHVFLTETLESERGNTFRTARYRDLGDRFAQRMVILEHPSGSVEPSAALRMGPDVKLHLALDDGGSAAAANRMSDWSGKLLRMEIDGRTPPDQAAASPVLFSGLTSPRGFDWTPDRSAIWLADASRDGIERLRVITTTSERPRRAGQRATFTMPRGTGAAGVAFHPGQSIREFAGDLLVAAHDGGYILRIRFAPDDRSRPMSTERLLEDRVGSVRAIAVTADGAIYFCTATALIRLRGVNP